MFNKIGKAKNFIEFLFEKKEFEEWIESRDPEIGTRPSRFQEKKRKTKM